MKKMLCFFIIFTFICSGFVQAKKITLSWDKNLEPDVTAYKIYSTNTSHQYIDKPQNISTDSNSCEYEITDGSQDMFFAVTAINEAGAESDFSNEVKLPHFPKAPQNIKIELTITIN